MKNKLSKKRSTMAILSSFGILSLLQTQAATILIDDFSTPSTPADVGRVFENQIDQGWRATSGFGSELDSAWDITENLGSGGVKGRLENATDDQVSRVQSEAPVWQWLTNPLTGNTDTVIRVSFDYDVGARDLLTAHFWAAQQGGTPTTPNAWITNNQAWINGNSAANQTSDISSGGYDTFNLLNGDTIPKAPDHITGTLSNSGTFTTLIDVSALMIPGVSTVGDLDTLFFAFAISEGGPSGLSEGSTTSVDNLSITTVPEPSSLALLGLGGVMLLRRRRQ